MTTIGDQINIVIKVMSDQFTAAMKQLAKFMQKLFPRVSEAHRREVKRVHNLYGRKRNSRKRRNRRR
jgi:hypothetical protein